MNARLQAPVIYLITKGDATAANFYETSRDILAIVRQAVEEKISLIQIREKQLSAKLFFELTAAAVMVTTGSVTRLLVNDRADIAIAAKADGVHLAAKSLPVGVIRKNFSKDFIIGVSTHSFDAIVSAYEQGADFAVFGPVFATPGKGEPAGLERLSDVCERVKPFSVLGLGGIDVDNCESVIAAGACGIAAIRSLNEPESLTAIARKFIK